MALHASFVVRRLSATCLAALAAWAIGAAEDASGAEPESPAAVEWPMHWQTSGDFAAADYRWSLSHGAFDLGMSFDTSGALGRRFGAPLAESGPLRGSLPSFSLGLRKLSAGPLLSSSSLLERAPDDGVHDVYASRVDIEWKPASSQLAFLRDGLGIRLGADDRLTMRLRKGVLGVYVKREF